MRTDDTQINWQFQGSTTRAESIKCPKCGTTSVICYGNDLYGCCNLECGYKWEISSIGNVTNADTRRRIE